MCFWDRRQPQEHRTGDDEHVTATVIRGGNGLEWRGNKQGQMMNNLQNKASLGLVAFLIRRRYAPAVRC